MTRRHSIRLRSRRTDQPVDRRPYPGCRRRPPPGRDGPLRPLARLDVPAAQLDQVVPGDRSSRSCRIVGCGKDSQCL